MHLMVLGAPDPRRVVRCPAWGNGPRVATGLRAPLGPGRAPLIEPGFAQFSQGPPPTGLQGVRATRCRRGHADPGGRAVFFRYQCAGAGREPGSPGSQTAGGMRSCGGRGASSNEGGSGIPALVCPAGAHRGDAVVGVVPCSRLGAGGLALVLGRFDAALLPLVWPAGAAVTGGTGW